MNPNIVPSPTLTESYRRRRGWSRQEGAQGRLSRDQSVGVLSISMTPKLLLNYCIWVPILNICFIFNTAYNQYYLQALHTLLLIRLPLLRHNNPVFITEHRSLDALPGAFVEILECLLSGLLFFFVGTLIRIFVTFLIKTNDSGYRQHTIPSRR